MVDLSIILGKCSPTELCPSPGTSVLRQGLNYVAQALLSFLIPSVLTSGVAGITGVSHPGWLCHHVAETES